MSALIKRAARLMTPRFERHLRRQRRAALEDYARRQRRAVAMCNRGRHLILLSRKKLAR